MKNKPVNDTPSSVNAPRYSDRKGKPRITRSDKKVMEILPQQHNPLTPKGGCEAQRGYGPARRIYDQRCKFCLGMGKLYSVISKEYLPCPECQE